MSQGAEQELSEAVPVRAGLWGEQSVSHPGLCPPKLLSFSAFSRRKQPGVTFWESGGLREHISSQGAELQPCCSRFEKADIYLCVQSGF